MYWRCSLAWIKISRYDLPKQKALQSVLRSHLMKSWLKSKNIFSTQKLPTNPMKLESPQIRSTIELYTISNNHQVIIRNIKIIQKDFSNWKERIVAEAFNIFINRTALNRKYGFTIHQTLTTYLSYRVWFYSHLILSSYI